MAHAEILHGRTSFQVVQDVLIDAGLGLVAVTGSEPSPLPKFAPFLPNGVEKKDTIRQPSLSRS